MIGLKHVFRTLWHGSLEQRSTLAGGDATLLEAFGGARSSAGISVTDDSAMRTSAVHACVQLIAESIASLPLHAFRRDGMRRKQVEGTALSRLLAEPNRNMTRFVFIELLALWLLLRGTAYAVILRNGAGEPIELLPVRPSDVRPLKTPGGEVAFEVRLDGKVFRVSQWDMLHVPGLGFDGIQGLSVVKYAAQSIGLAIAAEQYGGTFFGNGSMPSGYISLAGKLTPDGQRLLRESWQATYGGVSNANKTAVLFEGAKFEKISIDPEDAQLIESRKFQVSDIARWFRVPPHMIGDLERATFSNIEHQDRAFVMYTLRPWLVRLEQEFDRKLAPTDSSGVPSGIYTKFSVEGMLRGDTAARTAFYDKGRSGGWLSANDIRALEDLDPIEGGDQYLVPLNMSDAAKQTKQEGKEP